MKRLHIHISVAELAESIKFYSTMFNASPSVEHEDYAKWDLNDPAVNFAISKRENTIGLNHLGIQVDSDDELEGIAERLNQAEITSSKQQGTSCCYANSNKYWALDPQGIAWESFHTLGEIPIFGEDAKIDSTGESSACCVPAEISQTESKEEAECCSPVNSGNSGCCS